MHWIADVFVEFFGRGFRSRRLIRKLLRRREVELTRLRALRRPMVVLAPLVRPRFEDPRFRFVVCPLPLEVELKERKFNFLAIEVCRLRVEMNRAERFAGVARPLAVRPWSHDDRIS